MLPYQRAAALATGRTAPTLRWPAAAQQTHLDAAARQEQQSPGQAATAAPAVAAAVVAIAAAAAAAHAGLAAGLTGLKAVAGSLVSAAQIACCVALVVADWA